MIVCGSFAIPCGLLAILCREIHLVVDMIPITLGTNNISLDSIRIELDTIAINTNRDLNLFFCDRNHRTELQILIRYDHDVIVGNICPFDCEIAASR